MFAGYVTLESSIKGAILAKNSDDTPTNAAALPTFRVYGPNGYITGGTCSFLDTGTITGATNASPIVITCAGHGLTTGARVTITGVGGNTAANATWVVTRIDANTFSLDGSTGNGAYTSGGTWNATGAYRFQVDATAANGFAAGENYNVVFNFVVSSVTKGDNVCFCVV